MLVLQGCAGHQSFERRAETVLSCLAKSDPECLASYVHPGKGLRFSPSAYIDPESDQVFSAEQLIAAWRSDIRYLWGFEDGTGEPIRLTLHAYFVRFVYDADYAKAEQVAADRVIGRGNTVNNLAEIYPGTRFIEYHFSGFDPQYQGLDWKSLRLVFEQREGAWYLVAIVHDHWTI